MTKDPYLQVKEYHLSLPGLQNEATVLQISDLHIAAVEAGSTEAYRQHVAKQKQAWEPVRIDFARRYGDAFDEAHLLQPEEGLEHFLRYADAIQPDAVLFTGDLMNEYSEENVHVLRQAFSRLSCPWMWVRGNHELGHEETLHPMMQSGALAQRIQVGNLCLVGLDDAAKRVTAAQTEAAWKAAEGCIPVLVMHIPIRTSYNREATSCFQPYFLLGGEDVDAESQAFLDRLLREEDPFAAILCGHVHGHHVSFYRPDHPQICTSSGMVGACSLLHFHPSPDGKAHWNTSPS